MKETIALGLLKTGMWRSQGDLALSNHKDDIAVLSSEGRKPRRQVTSRRTTVVYKEAALLQWPLWQRCNLCSGPGLKHEVARGNDGPWLRTRTRRREGIRKETNPIASRSTIGPPSFPDPRYTNRDEPSQEPTEDPCLTRGRASLQDHH